MTERTCRNCGAVLRVKPGERPYLFAARQTCDRSCAASYRNRHRTRTPVQERFWAKVNKDGPTPLKVPDLGACWIWVGAQSSSGYGHFNRGPDHGLWIPAHRFAYELEIGPIPPSSPHLHHRCETPLCVNPSHLKPVTYAEHGQEHSTGFCQQGHDLALHGYYRKTGRRKGSLVQCRQCRRDARAAA